MHLTCEVNKYVLLTGAGFTRNFGGFLAKEMWALIFNHSEVGKYSKLKKLLKNDFDYESVYYKVIEGNKFDDNEKMALAYAVFSSYKILDDKIRGYRSLGTNQPVSINNVSKFIERFSGYQAYTGRNNTKGFFFTCNQDLFIERYYSSSNFKLITLGVSHPNISQDEEFDEKTHSVTLPLAADIERANPLSSSKFFYAKLHGSWNWYSSNSMKKMVIGRNKINQINTEPTLMRYLEIFKEVLLNKNVRLFVIGYGFADEHINEVIADSMEQNSLKLYVLNPTDPENFKYDLCKKPFGQMIFSGLIGYHPYNLSTVFPGDDRDTTEYELIRDSFFNAI